MNKQRSSALGVSFKITLVAMLLTTAGCQNKQDSENKDSASTVQTSVKAPSVDIHTAVISENVDAVKQHIAAGSNINEKDPFGGSSPLISASLFGKTDIAKLLIDAGADINFQNNDGSTALLTASFFCRPEIVKLLLDKGADKTIKNKYGATAYDTVITPFSEVKNTYDMMGKMLEPMGLKLDYAYIEKTRPEIAAMLK
jgi:uncharacterized protein